MGTGEGLWSRTPLAVGYGNWGIVDCHSVDIARLIQQRLEMVPGYCSISGRRQGVTVGITVGRRWGYCSRYTVVAQAAAHSPPENPAPQFRFLAAMGIPFACLRLLK